MHIDNSIVNKCFFEKYLTFLRLFIRICYYEQYFFGFFKLINVYLKGLFSF